MSSDDRVKFSELKEQMRAAAAKLAVAANGSCTVDGEISRR